MNKDCSELWVNFTCISSEANPPVYNYVLSDDEDGFSFSKSGTWIQKISRGGKSIYNCTAYQLVGNVKSTNSITLTVNGKWINWQLNHYYHALHYLGITSTLLYCTNLIIFLLESTVSQNIILRVVIAFSTHKVGRSECIFNPCSMFIVLLHVC